MNNLATRLGSILTASLLFTGCASTPFEPSIGFQEHREVTKTRIIDHAEQISKENSHDIETEGARGFSSLEHDQVILLGNKTVDAYLRSIADKILSAYPGPKPDYSIRCIFSDSLDAHASYSNNIFISTGWLINLSSEDELAAVIAHELSHIILKHPFTLQNRKDDQETIGKLTFLVSTMNALAESKGSSTLPENSKALSVFMTGAALLEIKKTLWDPEISRRQEEEADFLAIDLLDKAGYNREGMILVLQTLDRYRDSIRAKELKLEQEIEKRLNYIDNAIMSNIQAGNITQALNIGINSSINMLTETIHRQAESVINYLRRSHLDPVTREIRASEYITYHYTTLPPRRKTQEFSHALQKTGFDETLKAFTNIKLAETHARNGNILAATKLIKPALASVGDQSPYAWETKAMIERLQNNSKSEVSSLEKSIDLGGSPKAFNRLAEIYITKGRLNRALEILDAGEARYGDNSAFIPARLRVYAAKNDSINYDKTIEECTKQKSKLIRNACAEIDEKRNGKKSSLRSFLLKLGS